MSDKPNGYGTRCCDACGRTYTWGCGHSDDQERAAREHRATKEHEKRECKCFGHDHCDPKVCKLAGIWIRGYAPFYQHTEPPASGSKEAP